jgi:hypothetical protein
MHAGYEEESGSGIPDHSDTSNRGTIMAGGIAELAGKAAHHIGNREVGAELQSESAQGRLGDPGRRTGRIRVVANTERHQRAQNR